MIEDLKLLDPLNEHTKKDCVKHLIERIQD